MAERKAPLRTCAGCRGVKEKSGLIRIVRTPEGDVRADFTGRAAGRGTYLCPQISCLETALKKGGIAVVNTSAVKPVTESLKETGYDGSEMTAYLKEKCSCIFVNAEEVCRPFGSTKFFNIIMLGVAAGSGHLGLEKDTLLKQIEQRVPSRFLDVNLRAFQTGIEIAGQAVR